MAVAAGVQRRGHGRVLSALVENYSCRLGLTTLLVNAASEAIGYYEKMGWRPCIWDEAEYPGAGTRPVMQMTKALVLKS